MNNTAPYISVVIPAYNEEKRLPHTLRATIAYLEKQSYLWEIAVVNDGSTDNTVRVVQEIAKNNKNVILLEYGQNHGQGYAGPNAISHGRRARTGLPHAADGLASESVAHLSLHGLGGGKGDGQHRNPAALCFDTGQ